SVTSHAIASLLTHHCAFFIHQPKEFSKNIMPIMRTRPGFGMELNSEDRLLFHSQTFERAIIQTSVSDFHFLWIQVGFFHAIIVFLGCDKHPPAWQILNGMISAMMSKFEFVCVRAKRTANQLMTETNSKYRNATFDQSTHRFDNIR